LQQGFGEFVGQFFLKIIVFFLLIIFIAIGGLFLSLDTLLTKASWGVLEHINDYTKPLGIAVYEPRFSNARTQFPKAAIWTHLAGEIRLLNRTEADPNREFLLNIKTLTMSIESLKYQTILIDVRRLSLVPSNRSVSGEGVVENIPTSHYLGNRFDAEYIKIPLRVNYKQPEEAREEIKAAFADFADIFEVGYTERPIGFSGRLTFVIENMRARVKAGIKKREDRFYLVLDKSDLKSMSRSMKRPLTAPEIDILSEYAALAPRLLKIKERAENVSSQASKRNVNLSEDAYRHVLWSYLLTKEYGSEFAKRITDAHEIGDLDDSEKEHRMDYQNNAVGGAYATAGYPELSILTRVLVDPNVIREPV